MPTGSKVWGVRLGILLATCVGVFVLPFLLPAPYFQGVSASNLAGFNNRVAALAAAGLGTMVFFLALKWPQIIEAHADAPARGEELTQAAQGQLSRPLVAAVVLLWGGAVLLCGMQIIRSGTLYPADWDYFINQVSMHADFGRKLYTQIEFPYGPLLFYGPIAVRTILSPFHISEAGAYLVTLTFEISIGLLLVAYVIDHLPMSKRWKAFLFLLLALGMVPTNMGLNYTFFRFAPPLAFVVMASQRRRAWAAALWIFVGQAVCLGISPEIGFAFFVSSFGYAVYGCLTQGWKWVWGLVAPILSTAAFLLLVGRPYLRMVGMYAHGVMSFPVEPLPHILLFLFALVWLVPISLARLFRQRRPETPMLAALCLVSVALLPAALGRADPWHVFWNGLSVFLLSVVAISSRHMWQQIAWGACLALMFLWMCRINILGGRFEIGPVLHGAVAALKGQPAKAPSTDAGLNLKGLQAIVGYDPVVTPEWVPLSVVVSLREAGQYTPTFYYFQTAILDTAAEDREIQEFNQSKWALIPAGETYGYVERPEDLKDALGFQLPYRTRRPVYVIGFRFAKNLAENWRVRGEVGRYLVYEHVQSRRG